jgi:hypothetical protein
MWCVSLRASYTITCAITCTMNEWCDMSECTNTMLTVLGSPGCELHGVVVVRVAWVSRRPSQ